MSERNCRSRFNNFGGWIITIIGALTLVFAALMFGLGIWLATLGGSLYYAIGGAFFFIAGVGLLRERLWGFGLYVIALIGTIIWAFSEAGANVIRLLPRVSVWLTFFIILCVLWKWVGPRLSQLTDRTSITERPNSGLVPGLSVVVVVVITAISGFVFKHNGDPIDSLPDQISQSGSIANNNLPLAEEQSTGSEWHQYGGTSYGQRYSPLNQINVNNVKNLKRAWIAHASGPHDPSRPEHSFESTAIKVGNNLITCTSHSEAVALDATTGKVKWRFRDTKNGKNLTPRACRGVSFAKIPDSTGLCSNRVLFATLTSRLFALDAESGKLCPGFGQNGEVDLRTGLGEFDAKLYNITSPPVIVNGKAIVGSEVFDNVKRGEPSGVVRAYDTKTGALVWAFDLGRTTQTPLGAGETYTRGTPNAWAPLSADPKLGLVYLPMGNETPDFYGKGRNPKSEKFSSAIVALDVNTGKVRWKYQTVHHDLWDQDLPAQPVLADIPETSGAKPTPAVLVPTKAGQIFMFDRRTGRPLTKITEGKVPQGPAVDDWLSPTQPMPDFPSALGPRVTEASMWGITPLDQAMCRIRFKQYRYDGPFTPPSEQGSLSSPGSAGVYEWGGITVDPKKGVMYANSESMLMVTQLSRTRGNMAAGGDWGGPSYGTPYAVSTHPFLSILQIPCNQPPWGHFTAIDLVSKKVLWRDLLGNGRDNGPMGIASHVPLKIGVPNMGGSVATAGGVIFIGATADRTFRAIDADTGKELWSDVLPASAQATPTVYLGNDGREYVSISAGGHFGMSSKLGDTIITYALPTKK
ncbi:membrane-bound PQQ-dependent dehydrogenase, glucose/quinate/shikimate family [Rosenbergiella epipactidis]|uniref:membrane-bound PQQ-dependent dehydrogenase, glucose/quinate/shikimate family n=1 Tax=Rosenbergiella epipactidis TaxID=1544694 RepID=UPI00240D6B6E|nr:membrane-bound PQQ-dependent dehydrogenase, glucose/quinate/shikimate family [Rosenbergiella epipactidis]